MPRTGGRVILIAVIISAAVTVVAGYLLRMRLTVAVADPIAQAMGFVTMMTIGWPWVRERSDEPIKFPVFVAIVASIAVLMVFVRIKYFA